MSNTLWSTSSAPIFNRQTKTKTFQYDDIQLLQAEAQKIRNWHLQTEINTKNMEKVVQNLRLTVELQRKSLLEVQLEYEGIGNKMQEEVNKRTTCLQRIDATRDMCNLIKSQACELEDTLHFCGDIKDTIECSNTAQNDSFLRLASDFRLLSEDFETAKMQYNDKLSTLEEQSLHDKEEFSEKIRIQQNKIADCNERLDENDLTIDVLMHSVTKEQNELTEAKASIQKTNSSNLELLEIMNQLKLSLKVSDSIKKDQEVLLKTKENQINTKKEQLDAVQLANTHLKQQLEEEHAQVIVKQELHLEDMKKLENKLHTQTIKRGSRYKTAVTRITGPNTARGLSGAVEFYESLTPPTANPMMRGI